jgi:hypothetical protein
MDGTGQVGAAWDTQRLLTPGRALLYFDYTKIAARERSSSHYPGAPGAESAISNQTDSGVNP